MKINPKQILTAGAAAMAVIFVAKKFFPELADKVLNPAPTPLLKK